MSTTVAILCFYDYLSSLNLSLLFPSTTSREYFVQYRVAKSYAILAIQIWNWLAKYLCMNDKDEVKVRAWKKKQLNNNFQTKFSPV